MTGRGHATGIRVNVRRRNLNDHYTTLPNDLQRGKGIYSCLNEFERLLLGAGLSCSDDWETTLDEIESWLPNVGRDRQERFRRKLREEGFLSLYQGKDEHGRYVWVYEFFMDPLDVADRDELPAKKDSKPVAPRQERPLPPQARRSSGFTYASEVRRKAAGQSMPWDSGSENQGVDPTVEQVDETAGQSEPWRSGSRGANPEQPDPGVQGDIPITEKDQVEKNPPPSFYADHSLGTSADLESGGDLQPSRSNDRGHGQPGMPEAVAWILQLRPSWSGAEVAAVLEEAIAAGFGDLRRVTRAMHRMCQGVGCETPAVSPRRLIAVPDAAWWLPDAQERAEAAEQLRRERAKPKCRKHNVPSEPGVRCRGCERDDWLAEVEARREAAAAAWQPDPVAEAIRAEGVRMVQAAARKVGAAPVSGERRKSRKPVEPVGPASSGDAGQAGPVGSGDGGGGLSFEEQVAAMHEALAAFERDLAADVSAGKPTA